MYFSIKTVDATLTADRVIMLERNVEIVKNSFTNNNVKVVTRKSKVMKYNKHYSIVNGEAGKHKIKQNIYVHS